MAEHGARDTEKNREVDKSRRSPRQGSDWAAGTTSMAETAGDAMTATVGQIGTMMDQTAEQARRIAGDTMEQARNTVRNLGEQARAAMADPGATAQELARRAREQASVASEVLYQQGTRAGEYLSRNVNEYPLAALLIAGAIGYGLAYLIHTQWQSSSGRD